MRSASVGAVVGVCRVGLLGLVLVFVTGMLGAAFPLLDLVNHFQPFIALASLLLLALAWRLAEERDQLAWYALLAGVNVMLLLAPVLRLSAPMPSPAGQQLKVVTYNYLYWQQRHDEVVAFIRATAPDIVVLQEVIGRTAAKLEASLGSDYPHRHVCNRCDVALFSKYPLANIREFSRSWVDDNPPLVIASVLVAGREVRLAGVHLQNPEAPFRQARQLVALQRQLAGIGGPMILAGDLNLTPWSWSLNRLADTLSLRRHTGLGGTWSTSTAHLLPWFPIDHVLTTRDIGLVSIERGPNLGSDHLPVIATLVLPRT